MNSRGLGRLLVIVRVSKKLGKSWVARHEKDGLDEWKIATFVRSQYMLGSFERTESDVLKFRFRFRKEEDSWCRQPYGPGNANNTVL